MVPMPPAPRGIARRKRNDFMRLVRERRLDQGGLTRDKQQTANGIVSSGILHPSRCRGIVDILEYRSQRDGWTPSRHPAKLLPEKRNIR